MKKMILPLLIAIITTTGTWSANNVINKPDIVARGQMEKQTDDCGLDLVGAHLGTTKTSTINGSVEAGAHQIFSGSGSVALGGARKISDVWFASPPAAPENSPTTPVGSLFIKASGRAPHTYFKENRTGNSDWTALSVAGQDPDAEYLKGGEGDINSFSEKVKPSDANLSLIKDSGAGYAKKKAQLNNPSGGGGGKGWLNLLGNPGYETLANAKRTIGNNQATLVIPAGTINVTSDPALPSNIELLVLKGAIFNISSGVTCTFQGPFRAGNNRHFVFGSNTSKVKFDNNQEVNAVWYTNGGSGSVNSPWTGADGLGGIGEAIKYTYAAAGPADGLVVLVPVGQYTVTDTININHNGIYIKGAVDGMSWRYNSAPNIYFNPASAKTLFYLRNTHESYILYNCGISGLHLRTNSYANTAIKCSDVSACDFRFISILWWDNGTGIDWRGRDTSLFHRMWIEAAAPIRIGKNDGPLFPTPDASSIDCDAIVFRDCWFYCKSSAKNSACVTIASGVNLTHTSFQGWISFSGGHHGLYWNDTSSTIESHGFSIENAKLEAADLQWDGWAIYIRRYAPLDNLVIANATDMHHRAGGIYLRGIRNAKISNLLYYPGKVTGTSIDAAGIGNLVIENLLTNSPTSLNSMIKAFAVENGDPEKISLAVFTKSTPTVTVYGK